MEPRCPECRSLDIDPPLGAGAEWRCRNCGALFPLEGALVTFAEAEAFGRDRGAGPTFIFHREEAEAELREGDLIAALSPYSDAEELMWAVDQAVEQRLIEERSGCATLHLSRFGDPGDPPVVVVGLGTGPRIIAAGPAQRRRPGDDEDPVTFTLSWLERIVADANAALAALPASAAAEPIGASPLPAPGAYTAVAFAPYPDAIGGRQLASAEGLSISGVLAILGERLEGAAIDPAVDGLDVAVSWRRRGGGEG